MQDILFEYELNPTTWAYLSALLTIGIYFKFNRLFSVRNLDLLGLIIFSPGLLLVFYGMVKKDPSLVQFGFAWLLAVGLLFVVRLFLDPLMVRRPMLDPNLSASGLTFTGIAILVFLTANVVSERPPNRLEFELASDASSGLQSPGCRFLYFLASFRNAPKSAEQEAQQQPDDNRKQQQRQQRQQVPKRSQPKADWTHPSDNAQMVVSRTIAILAQLATVIGIALIGYYHFGSLQTGTAAAVLYLLLPYVGQMGGRIDHVVPAALLVWAMAAYRRPLISGFILGLAGGLIFYPLFLLPLGCSYYWQRGLRRFVLGALLGILVMVVFVICVSGSPELARSQLQQMFGDTIFSREDLVGFWQAYHRAYRIPVLAVFVVLCGSLALWPAQKNFGTLLSCSATVMLASQFCQGFEGGLYMAWYLPLLVLTTFRPNLEDRVALNAVIERRALWVGRLARRNRRPA